MANNYVQGTIWPSAIPLTDAQATALGMDAQDLPSKDEPEERKEFIESEGEAGTLFARWVDEFGLEYGTGIGCDKYPEGWYLYCENGLDEGGDAVLQDILKTLPEDKFPHLTYEYAAWCGKLRPSEFGGGCCLVTRTDIRWGSTHSLLHGFENDLKRTPKILAHLDHVLSLEVATYGGHDEGDTDSVVVECTKCGEVVKNLWEKS